MRAQPRPRLSTPRRGVDNARAVRLVCGMVIVLRQGITDPEKQAIRETLEGRGFKVKEIVGEEETILGAVGIVAIDLREVELLPGVASVIPITKPYKLASREFKQGRHHHSRRPGQDRRPAHHGRSPGPARSRAASSSSRRPTRVRESGAVILRGGAFKPRTSPYAFQGLGEEGLRYLKEAGEATGMPVISEIMSPGPGGRHARLRRHLPDRRAQHAELRAPAERRGPRQGR